MLTRALVVTLLLGIASGFTSAASAQSAAGISAAPASHGAAHSIPVPSAHAARRTSPIVLDGSLDDAAWQSAEPITELLQVDPDEGKPQTERTEVRFLFDDDALYIGARMYDRAGAKGVTTQLVRRDGSFTSDWFQVVIDGYHDHLGRAFFTVNPSGSRQDAIGVGSSCCDDGWDPVWEAAAKVDSLGWVAELRIPLSQLRFSRDSEQTWGLQVRRFIQRNNEQDQWAFWYKKEFGGPSRFGHLEDIRIASQPSHLEVMPYVVGRAQAVAHTPGDPFNNGHRKDSRIGADVMYLLTPNLTLNATINPDFGQVEVDPAQVNLSAFETYFQEKRPFFVEGAGVFNFGMANCNFCSNFSGVESFYSRRIGRAPVGSSLAYAEGTYADVPDASTILGAAKVTGRTTGGWTIGMLDAVTSREQARVQRDDGTQTHVTVEPLTNFLVTRLKKDSRGGNTVQGLYASSVVRNLEDAFKPTLNTHSEMYGYDLEQYWNNRTYSFLTSLMYSNIAGDRRAITARQQSSARYYQRPDDRRVVDTLATSMQGAGAYMRIAKDAGDWFWELMGNTRTPGFEVNDIAFQSKADYIWFNGNIGRYYSKPTSWYRTMAYLVGAQYQRNYQGLEVVGRDFHAGAFGTTPSNGNMQAFIIVRPSLLDDRLLRGGPAVVAPGSSVLSATYNTDARRRIVANLQVQHAWNTERGFGENVYTSVQWRPASYVSVSAGPSFSRTRAVRQYVSAVADPTATAFGGTRYVLAGLDQKTISMDTRLTVTFTPRMSFELYAQPFFSAGQYDSFREYRAPRDKAVITYGRDAGSIAAVRDAAGRVTSYTIDPDGSGPAASFTLTNPDFNYRSLRGNAVYRWEFRPGSTLYLVWTQERSSSDVMGEFDFSRDQRALFEARPDNIFLLKINWWLSR